MNKFMNMYELDFEGGPLIYLFWIPSKQKRLFDSYLKLFS